MPIRHYFEITVCSQNTLKLCAAIYKSVNLQHTLSRSVWLQDANEVSTRHGTTRHDTTRHVTSRYDTARHHTARHDTTGYDTTRRGTIRHETTR